MKRSWGYAGNLGVPGLIKHESIGRYSIDLNLGVGGWGGWGPGRVGPHTSAQLGKNGLEPSVLRVAERAKHLELCWCRDRGPGVS